MLSFHAVSIEYHNNVCDMQESLRLSRMTRFYIKQKEDPHGPHIAIYISNLPTALSQRQYEHILLDIVGRGNSIKSYIIE